MADIDPKVKACLHYMQADELAEDKDEVALVTELMQAAEIYLGNAGISRPAEHQALYNLALHSLTLHYYDHRDAVGSEAPLPTGLRPIINQLKMSQHAERICETLY